MDFPGKGVIRLGRRSLVPLAAAAIFAVAALGAQAASVNPTREQIQGGVVGFYGYPHNTRGFYSIFESSTNAVHTSSRTLYAQRLANMLWPEDTDPAIAIARARDMQGYFNSLAECRAGLLAKQTWDESDKDKNRSCNRQVYALAFLMTALGRDEAEANPALAALPARTREQRQSLGEGFLSVYNSWRGTFPGFPASESSFFAFFSRFASDHFDIPASFREGRWRGDNPTLRGTSSMAQLLNLAGAAPAPGGPVGPGVAPTPPGGQPPFPPTPPAAAELVREADGAATLDWSQVAATPGPGAHYHWGGDRGQIASNGVYDDWNAYDARGGRVGNVFINANGVYLFHHYGSGRIFPYNGGLSWNRLPSGRAQSFGTFHGSGRITRRTVQNSAGQHWTDALAPAGAGANGLPAYIGTDGMRYETHVEERTYYRSSCRGPLRRRCSSAPYSERVETLRQAPRPRPAL